MNIKVIVFSAILLSATIIYAVENTGNNLTQPVDQQAELNKKLLSAASGGYTEDMIEAIKAGADVNSKDTYGVPVIINAVDSYDNAAKIDFLIRSNVDVNATDNDGWNALFYIVSKEIYKGMGGKGGDGEKPEDPHVWMNKMAALLIKVKIDVIKPDKNGNTVLQLAIKNKHKEIEKMIRKAGAKK